jgi:hypothetical protein
MGVELKLDTNLNLFKQRSISRQIRPSFGSVGQQLAQIFSTACRRSCFHPNCYLSPLLFGGDFSLINDLSIERFLNFRRSPGTDHREAPSLGVRRGVFEQAYSTTLVIVDASLLVLLASPPKPLKPIRSLPENPGAVRR